MPELDAGRAADAEIRVALFEVLNGHPIAALSRLRTISTPVSGDTATRWRREPDRQFLLAECFYRLGMDDSMRVAAEAVLAGPAAGRYGAVLRTQLLFSAYRNGDLTRALTEMKDVGHDEQTAMSALFSGLVAYQSGDLGAARAAFTRAQQLSGAGPYADYARYMGAIAAVRADTAHASATIASVRCRTGIGDRRSSGAAPSRESGDDRWRGPVRASRGGGRPGRSAQCVRCWRADRPGLVARSGGPPGPRGGSVCGRG